MKTTSLIKIRRSWGVTNPVTKRINSKKIYSRKSKFNRKLVEN